MERDAISLRRRERGERRFTMICMELRGKGIFEKSISFMWYGRL